MYRFVVLSVLIVKVLAGDSEEQIKKCYKAFQPEGLLCCKTAIAEPDINTNPELKECLDMPFTPHSCEKEECVAKKLGYYGADGNLVKEKLLNNLEKKLEKDQKLLNNIKEKCVNYDITKFGPPHWCIYKRMKHCLYNQFLMHCPDWNNEGECNGMTKLAEECTMKY